MVYFIRYLTLFLIIFVGLSVALQHGYRHFYGDQATMLGDVSQVTQVFIPQARDTKTGLLLAGMTAQNRRDWASAWQFFSTFNDKYHNSPQVALKAMTLALGNGSYAQAKKLALEINSYNHEEYPEIKHESFDLARLFLLLDAVKNNNVEVIETLKESLKDGVLAQFAIPIMNDWVAAAKTPDAIDTNTKDLSVIQIYYKALAAEYAEKNEIAKSLMDDVNRNALAPNKIMNVASFYYRIGENDVAIEVLQNASKIFVNNTFIQEALDILKTTPDSYQPSYGSDFHLRGMTAALSMAFYDFAMLMLNEQASDSALLFVRLAAYLDEQSPSVYAMIGSILHADGRLDEALKNYKKVDFNDIEFESSLAKTIDILVEKNQLDDAKNLVLDAIKQSDAAEKQNPYLYYFLGNIYKEQNNFEEAIKAYDAAEVIGNHNGNMPQKLWPLYYSRAIAFDLSDQWDKAEADLKIALDKFPNNPMILNYLGYAYADRNVNLDKAKEMISQAVMMAPNDAYIIDSMGWVYYRTGDYADAVKYLERAAMLEPYHMVINDHLGDAYWKVGRKLEAKYMWQRAIDYYKAGDEEQDRMIEETRRKVIEGL